MSDLAVSVKACAEVFAAVGIITEEQRIAVEQEVNYLVTTEQQKLVSARAREYRRHKALPWWKRLWEDMKL